MRLHRVPLPVHERRHVDRRAEPISRPALRLHRERLHVLGELGHEPREVVDELGLRDEAVATLHVHVVAELGLVARDAGELDRAERALARRDVIGMSVAAVRSPGDDDIRPDLAQPADDVADDVLLFDAREIAVGVLEARDRDEAHPAPGLLELQRSRRADVLARDHGRALAAGPAFLSFGEAEAVHGDAFARVADERAARAERLVVGMREDRREREGHRRAR